MVAVASEAIWTRFCSAIERPELATDARFEKNSQRVQNRDLLIRLLKEMFFRRKSSEWMELLHAASVPCSPVQTIDQALRSPQVMHRHMVTEVEHPTAGTVSMAGIPLKFSDTPDSYYTPAILAGQAKGSKRRCWKRVSPVWSMRVVTIWWVGV